MEETSSKPKLAPALERGVQILDLVAHSKAFLSLSEIARELKIARSSAYTLCFTLVQSELLFRRNDQTYQLGPHVMRWSNAFTQHSDVAAEFASIWDKETELPGATITLSVLDGSEVVYIAARNSIVSHSRIQFRIGMRLPAAFTATGKAFLSSFSDFEIRKLFPNGLPPGLTPNSVQDMDTLLREMRNVREAGYSCDEEQVAEGIVCFGAPVFDSRNRPIAGIAVSLPTEDLTQAERPLIIANVQRIAMLLSRRMGADLSRTRPVL